MSIIFTNAAGNRWEPLGTGSKRSAEADPAEFGVPDAGFDAPEGSDLTASEQPPNAPLSA